MVAATVGSLGPIQQHCPDIPDSGRYHWQAYAGAKWDFTKCHMKHAMVLEISGRDYEQATVGAVGS